MTNSGELRLTRCSETDAFLRGMIFRMGLLTDTDNRWSVVVSHHSVLIRRRLEDVFRYVATDFFDNYPQWSPEVCELEKLTAGDMAVGVKARQVRLDAGYRSEALFRVTEFECGHMLRFTSLSQPRFEVCYRFEHADVDTRLTFEFRTDLPLYLLPVRGYLEKVIRQGGGRVVTNLKMLLEAEEEAAVDDLRPGCPANRQ